MVIDNTKGLEQSCPSGQTTWPLPLPPDMGLEATDTRWFAGLAMQAIISKVGVPTSNALREEIALWSFRMAEAMVRADDLLHGNHTHQPE